MESGNGKEYKMPSGALLVVSVSDYDRVVELHDALANELRGKGLGQLDIIEVIKTINGEGEQGLNVLADKAIGLASSREFKAAIFACAEKAVYCPDGELRSAVTFAVDKPGYGVFDHPKHKLQARGDFYAICRAIVEENLRPFGAALSSMFKALMEKRADSLKSSTATA